MRRPLVRERVGRPRCPLCKVDVHSGGETECCPGCGVRYHSDCLHELGGCATLGCDRLGVAPDAPLPALQTRRARLRRLRDGARERRRERPRLREAHRAELLRSLEGLEARERRPRPREPFVSMTWLAEGLGFVARVLLEILGWVLIGL
ncbi:MAG: hypothetical protein R3F62_28040 [Planctomycetota bacterium]